MEQDILIPIGSHKGETTDAVRAIYKLAGTVAVRMEILLTLYQNSLIESEREQLSQEFMSLEQIFISLISIYYQMDPHAWEVKPRKGLFEIAEEYGLVLPEWMKVPG